MNSRNKWLQTLPASVPVILFMFTVKQFYYVLGYFNLVSVSVGGNLNHVGFFYLFSLSIYSRSYVALLLASSVTCFLSPNDRSEEG